MAKELYSFGAFTVDPAKRRLLHNNNPAPLTPKAFDMLLVLIANRGEKLSRAELIGKVWPDTEAGERNLNQSIAVLRKTLGDNPKQPEFIATLPGYGYSFIGDVRLTGNGLGFESESTTPPPSSNQDAKQFVAGEASGSKVRSAPQVNPSRVFTRSIVAAVCLFVMLAGSLAVYRFAYFHPTAPEGSAHHSVRSPRSSVAVLGFENLSRRPEDAWLSTALSEMLSTEIGLGGKLRIVPGESVARARSDLKIVALDGLSRGSLSRIQQELAADFIVSGAYASVSPLNGKHRQIRFDVRIQNAVTAEILASASITGSVEQLFDLVSRSGAKLRESLGVEPISPEESEQARAAHPSNPDAERLYAEGLAKLQNFDALGARDSLQQAVAADPSFPLAHLAMANAYADLDEKGKEIESAKKALALSSHLSREQQLWIQARYAQAEENWQKAKEVTRALVTFYPDNLEYALALAESERVFGNGSEAQRTLEELRKMPPPLSNDPRIDLQEVRVRAGLSEFQQGLAAARRAAEKAQTRGARWLYAHSLLAQAAMLASMADYQHSLPLDEQAREICTQLGDRSCIANVYRRIGNMKVDSDARGAEQSFRQGLQIARQIGSKVEARNNLNGLAVVLSYQGRFSEADRLYRDCLADMRQKQNAWGIQMFLNNLGDNQIEEGNLTDAEKMEQQALVTSRQSGQKLGIADALTDLGRIAELEADLDTATKEYQEAISIFQQIDARNGIAAATAGLASVSRARGQFAVSEDEYKLALSLLSPATDQGAMAEIRLGMARLYLQQNRSADAASLAQMAVEGFQRQNRTDGVLRARTVLAQALLAQGQVDQALAEVAWTKANSLSPEARLSQLMVEIGRAQVMATIDQRSSPNQLEHVLEHLEAAAKEAESRRLRALALDARVTKNAIQAKAGSSIAQKTEHLPRLSVSFH